MANRLGWFSSRKNGPSRRCCTIIRRGAELLPVRDQSRESVHREPATRGTERTTLNVVALDHVQHLANLFEFLQDKRQLVVGVCSHVAGAQQRLVRGHPWRHNGIGVDTLFE